MKNQFKKLTVILCVFSIALITNSCSKENIALKKIEGNWESVNFEYPPNYLEAFANGTGRESIDVWEFDKLNFKEVDKDGLGDLFIYYKYEHRRANIFGGYDSEIASNEYDRTYSISEDGKFIVFNSSTTGIPYDEWPIIKLTATELVLDRKAGWSNSVNVRVTYTKRN